MPGNRILGGVLVALGAFMIVVTQTGVGAEAIVLFIGAAFLTAFAVTRSYGFLVPGGILTGLGGGIVAESAGFHGAVVPVGLGLGFIAIAVVHVIVTRGREDWWWWPLIPGGIITLAGLQGLPETVWIARLAVPAVLIAVGLVLLFRRPASRRH